MAFVFKLERADGTPADAQGGGAELAAGRHDRAGRGLSRFFLRIASVWGAACASRLRPVSVLALVTPHKLRAWLRRL
jgi:hypothetical protein